jgi:hypothetical protein
MAADGNDKFSPLIRPSQFSGQRGKQNANPVLIGCQNLVEGGESEQSLFSKSRAKWGQWLSDIRRPRSRRHGTARGRTRGTRPPRAGRIAPSQTAVSRASRFRAVFEPKKRNWNHE